MLRVYYTIKKANVMSNERKYIEKFANWPAIALFSLELGGVLLLFLVWIKLLLTIDSSIIGYICAGLLISIGILIIVFSTIIGSFLYEANRRELTWLWKNVFRYEDEVIKKVFSRPPYECGFIIWITRIIGIGVISTSIMSFFLNYSRI